MIDKALKLLNLNHEFAERLRNLWRELSSYLHFSYAFLEVILKNPELLLLEVMNPKMFRKALDLYFETLDLYYTVLTWRFPQLRGNIRKMIEWWKQNFNKTFSLTEPLLKTGN